jgi:hypothetical protein
MLTRPYDGASALVTLDGQTAIECATPELAAWLERLINAAGGLVTSLESANQFRIARSEIEVAQVWRAYPHPDLSDDGGRE